MSTSQSQYRITNYFTGADADLLLRLRIALSVKKRAGWHLVAISVQSGIVHLAGVVPSFYDRQLIAALVRHVAGVLAIEDKLSVGDPSIRQQVVEADEAPARSDSKANDNPPQNAFRHLPTIPLTLDDIIAGQAVSASQAN
jgi:BON domain-containing protein